MKNRRITYLGTMVLGILILSLLVLSGCSGQQSPVSSATPGTTQTSTVTQTSPTTQVPPPSSTQPQSAKTLKIGISAWFSSSNSLDAMNAIDMLAEQDNKNGGWDIGGEKYNIEIIKYDNNNSQPTEVASINRLVFVDKVKFIFAAGTFEDGWEKLTEANKIIVSTWAPAKGLDPKLHYVFNHTFGNTSAASITGWFCAKYPDLVKNFVDILPDNGFGRVVYSMLEPTWKAFAVTPTAIYYPETLQDLSSVGTKVASINPGSVSSTSGNDVGDGLVYNAIYNAGYRGQLFTSTFSSAEALSNVINSAALEGFICGAFPTEFDPPLTQVAKDFKDAWIAKYGKWTSPNVQYVSSYYGLKAALQQAGTIDTDKVAEVISSGMKFSSAAGNIQMISRPDFGNARTIDSIGEVYIKQIHKGKAELLGTISLDEAMSYAQKVLSGPPALPPGPPPGGPPPG